MLELAECARREVKQRQRVYARLVEAGKMSGAKADHEIALMTAIADYFETRANPSLPLT